MNKIAFYILVVLFALSSCKKNENHQTIDADIIANFNYKPGTYWIYKDSISGREDSFFVTSNTGMFSTNNNGTFIDAISIQLSDVIINSLGPKDNVELNLGLYSDGLILELQYFRLNKTIDKIVYVPFVTYPFSFGPISSKYIGGNNNSNLRNIFEKYDVNGNSFFNTAELNQFYNILPTESFTDWFYINSDVFLVKMRLNHPHDSLNRVWEIERWKIIK